MALPTNFRKVLDKTPKNRGNDRILQLKIKDGTKPKSSTGLVDSRMFTGNNKLHAIYDEMKQMWFLKYEKGELPAPLQCYFTSFTMLMKTVVPYFEKRNIEITEITNA